MALVHRVNWISHRTESCEITANFGWLGARRHGSSACLPYIIIYIIAKCFRSSHRIAMQTAEKATRAAKKKKNYSCLWTNGKEKKQRKGKKLAKRQNEKRRRRIRIISSFLEICWFVGIAILCHFCCRRRRPTHSFEFFTWLIDIPMFNVSISQTISYATRTFALTFPH